MRHCHRLTESRSTPLPPISRLEDHSQTRRCARLRKSLRLCFADILPKYTQACTTLKPLAEEMDLEKYYDIYDVSDADFADAMLGYTDKEFDDAESVRVLKIFAARFHAIRKIFLCCLMALDARGGRPDLSRWTTALDEIRAVAVITSAAEARLRQILNEEESKYASLSSDMQLTLSRLSGTSDSENPLDTRT